MLKPFRLVWNARSLTLICQDCHVGIPGWEAESHCKSHGLTKKKLVARGFNQDDYDKVFQGLREQHPKDSRLNKRPEDWNPLEGCPPVQGLYIFEGLKCKLCHHCVHLAKSMQNHFSRNHAGKCFGL